MIAAFVGIGRQKRCESVMGSATRQRAAGAGADLARSSNVGDAPQRERLIVEDAHLRLCHCNRAG